MALRRTRRAGGHDPGETGGRDRSQDQGPAHRKLPSGHPHDPSSERLIPRQVPTSRTFGPEPDTGSEVPPRTDDVRGTMTRAGFVERPGTGRLRVDRGFVGGSAVT